MGITNKDLFWSFGAYAKYFICLVLLFAMYFLIREIMYRCCPKMKIVERLLRKKLFYSSVIRYSIQANLKVTHNTIFFLYLKGSFGTTAANISTAFNIFIIVILVLWPPVLACFLIKTRHKHEKHSFITKYHSLYLFNKTDGYLENGQRRN